jgi:hypothetical protein
VVCRVEAEPQHVRLHDAHPAPESSPEPGDPGRVELDGGDLAVALGEPARQGTVAGTEFQDGPGRYQRRDTCDHAAVDEEVLSEFVTAAERAAGCRGHG